MAEDNEKKVNETNDSNDSNKKNDDAAEKAAEVLKQMVDEEQKKAAESAKDDTEKRSDTKADKSEIEEDNTTTRITVKAESASIDQQALKQTEEQKESDENASDPNAVTKSEESKEVEVDAKAKEASEVKQDVKKDADENSWISLSDTQKQAFKQWSAEHKANIHSEAENDSEPVSDGTGTGKKLQEKNRWKTAWIAVGFVAVAMFSGAIGGALMVQHKANQLADALMKETEKYSKSNNNINNFDPYDFDDDDNSYERAFGNNGNNNNNGSSQKQEIESKAALGIMVKESDSGVEIVDFLSGTNADSAGLKKGDIITAIDNNTVNSFADLKLYLAKKDVGDTVEITVSRNKKTMGPYKVKLIKSSKVSNNDAFSDGQNIKK